ncbi:hypothetical protein EVAR_81570_1 [Eumeta japonica]|uniref:Uncharacterized protein n=1 Tax=Eumeta variegata TaxID=151549 RepID=A0A4C1V164_EUMVA|nr:hypothetical protein EVAR_81570_1 [Eumeta japonica]
MHLELLNDHPISLFTVRSSQILPITEWLIAEVSGTRRFSSITELNPPLCGANGGVHTRRVIENVFNRWPHLYSNTEREKHTRTHAHNHKHTRHPAHLPALTRTHHAHPPHRARTPARTHARTHARTRTTINTRATHTCPHSHAHTHTHTHIYDVGNCDQNRLNESTLEIALKLTLHHYVPPCFKPEFREVAHNYGVVTKAVTMRQVVEMYKLIRGSTHLLTPADNSKLGR